MYDVWAGAFGCCCPEKHSNYCTSLSNEHTGTARFVSSFWKLQKMKQIYAIVAFEMLKWKSLGDHKVNIL